MKNNVGAVLRGLGYLFIVLYFIAGLFVGTMTMTYGSDFNFGVAFAIWLAGFTLGSLLVGIGTIVEQLKGLETIRDVLFKIRNAMESLSVQESNSQNNKPDSDSSAKYASQENPNDKRIESNYDGLIRCPVCGRLQGDNFKKCYNCGAKLIQ